MVPFDTVPLEPECPVETVPLLYAPPAAVVCATSVLLSKADEASEITTTEEASVMGRMVASVMVRIEEASVIGRMVASVMVRIEEEGEASVMGRMVASVMVRMEEEGVASVMVSTEELASLSGSWVTGPVAEPRVV